VGDNIAAEPHRKIFSSVMRAFFHCEQNVSQMNLETSKHLRWVFAV